jgi:hypothetical protein
MWTCPNCGRIFEKAKQPHSCRKVPLEDHFKNKDKAKELFDYIAGKINITIGVTKIISLPCCVHLFGTYDFFAALPHRDSLEIRWGSDHDIKSARITQHVPISQTSVKNCLYLRSIEEIDEELLGWLKQSYHLKDK